ncbi:homocitrate synthase [Kineothrix sedimenti]|uniref:Homocitrate synthase n=1 Tax=Kineothrix sedimenti TaxID=3123317 RepID=A0ABZ3F0Q8_9FIRM
MRKAVSIVDTTLRDGEQCPGITFSAEDKIRLAVLLDRAGVYEIEAGIYDTGTEGHDYIRKIMQNRKKALVSVWSLLNPECVEQAARQKPDLIHIGTPVSYVQIYRKLNKNKKWVENVLQDCIQVAKDYGVGVTVGLEDASRADVAFMNHLLRLMEGRGVETVRLADTVGILCPQRARQMVRELKEVVSLKVEIHEHNDFGMAVANSIVMAAAGADMVDATLSGIGERAGNCDLYQFVHAAGRKFELEVKNADIRRAQILLKEMMAGGKNYDTGDII